jgi:hypothetical protein
MLRTPDRAVSEFAERAIELTSLYSFQIDANGIATGRACAAARIRDLYARPRWQGPGPKLCQTV